MLKKEIIYFAQYNSIYRFVIPADEHYNEYLEDVADHCIEDVEETNKDGKYIIHDYN